MIAARLHRDLLAQPPLTGGRTLVLFLGPRILVLSVHIGIRGMTGRCGKCNRPLPDGTGIVPRGPGGISRNRYDHVVCP